MNSANTYGIGVQVFFHHSLNPTHTLGSFILITRPAGCSCRCTRRSERLLCMLVHRISGYFVWEVWKAILFELLYWRCFLGELMEKGRSYSLEYDRRCGLYVWWCICLVWWMCLLHEPSGKQSKYSKVYWSKLRGTIAFNGSGAITASSREVDDDNGWYVIDKGTVRVFSHMIDCFLKFPDRPSSRL